MADCNSKKQSGKKTLVIAFLPYFYSFSAKKLLSFTKTLDKETIFVSFDLCSQNLFKKANLTFKSSRAYISNKDFEEISRQASIYLSRVFNKNGTADNHDRGFCLSHYAVTGAMSISLHTMLYMEFLIRKVVTVEEPYDIKLIAEDWNLLDRKFFIEVLKKLGKQYSVINPWYYRSPLFLPINLYLLTRRNALKFLRRIDLYIATATAKMNHLKKITCSNTILPAKDRILILGYWYIQDLKQIIPAAKELIRRGKDTLVILNCIENKKAIKMLFDAGIPFCKMKDYADKKIIEKARNKQGFLQEELKKLKSTITDAFEDKTYITARILKLEENYFFSNAKNNLIFSYVIEKIFDDNKPKVIILNNNRLGLTKLIESRAKKRKTSIVEMPSYVDQSHRLHKFYKFFSGDIVLLSGEAVKEHWVENGINPHKINVVGTTHWDAFLKNKPFLNHEQICKRFHLDPRKQLWVFTTQGFAEESLYLDMIMAVIKDYPQSQMIVKLHPFEGGIYKRLQVLFSGMKNIKVVKNAPTRDIIADCQFLITMHSITAIEAMILGKPVITLDTYFIPYPHFYSKEQAVAVVTDKEELSVAINNIMTDPAYKEKLIRGGRNFVNRYLNGLKGNTASLIADAVEQTIQSKSVPAARGH